MHKFLISYTLPKSGNHQAYIGKNGDGLFQDADQKGIVHEFVDADAALLWTIEHFIKQSLHTITVEDAAKCIMSIRIQRRF